MTGCLYETLHLLSGELCLQAQRRVKELEKTLEIENVNPNQLRQELAECNAYAESVMTKYSKLKQENHMLASEFRIRSSQVHLAASVLLEEVAGELQTGHREMQWAAARELRLEAEQDELKQQWKKEICNVKDQAALDGELRTNRLMKQLEEQDTELSTLISQLEEKDAELCAQREQRAVNSDKQVAIAEQVVHSEVYHSMSAQIHSMKLIIDKLTKQLTDARAELQISQMAELQISQLAERCASHCACLIASHCASHGASHCAISLCVLTVHSYCDSHCASHCTSHCAMSLSELSLGLIADYRRTAYCVGTCCVLKTSV